jgi:transposase
LKGDDVVRTLHRVKLERGVPQLLFCDNGSEFTSHAMDLWAYRHGSKIDFSRPGKPTDNAFVESFNGTFRAECLDTHWFVDLKEARQLGCVHTMAWLSVKLFLPMELTEAQYERIKDALPVQRGNVSLSNLQVLNAVLYVAEQGCKWRGLPKRFGRWHTVYMRMSRWSKSGVLDRVFEKLQVEQIVRIKLEAVSLDSTSIKVHPDGTGALKKTAHSPSARAAADGTPRCIWLPRMLERP